MQGITFNLDPEMVEDEVDRSTLQEIVNNTKLNEGYLTLARDIDVMEAKRPEDIYKVCQVYLVTGSVFVGVSYLFDKFFVGSLS